MAIRHSQAHQYDAVHFFEFGYSPSRLLPFLKVHCYWLDGVLIDTAQRRMQPQVLSALQSLPIHSILLTHYHEDHSGNAAALSQQTQAPVYAGMLTQQLMQDLPPILPYQHWAFGAATPLTDIQPLPEVIETEHYRLEPLFCPGHSPDHYAFLEPSQGWLFAGDLFLGKLKYTRRDENPKELMASIERVLQYDFDVLFCAHNPRLTQGKQALAEKLAYLQALREEANYWHRKGYGLSAIQRKVKLPDSLFVRLWTWDDVRARYLIQGLLDAPITALIAAS
ncbi:MBL fold metallo-hydrolase [Eisenibacter elegans]|uniref:MBL fold metallo-hydrolase n=1 Tax=Eisenibacter elegans TaxID=997 RepID=UPI0003F54A36|nr:MBL fold metallo-hydrolase [Eisenibacter elegans]